MQTSAHKTHRDIRTKHGLEAKLEFFSTKAPVENFEEVISAINGLTSAAFGEPAPRQETYDHWNEADVVFLAINGCGQLVGYSFNTTMQIGSTPVNYFGSSFVKPDRQFRGVYQAMNEVCLDELAHPVAITRTQNPALYVGFRRSVEARGYRLSPEPDGIIHPSALAIAKLGFPKAGDDLICKSVYPRELMGDGGTPQPKGEAALVFGKLHAGGRKDMIILVAERM